MVKGKKSFSSILQICGTSLDVSEPPSVKLIQSAWHSFAKLLNVNYNESFKCPVCGTYP